MTIGVGVIGLGFMGKTHIAAYEAARDACEVVAVCDRHADPAQLVFANPRVHLVSICTYTDSHVELATRALRAGKHVLVEKPVALDPGAIRALAREAGQAQRICMPAMCMRFWPGWDWLRARIRERTFGRVSSATFTRIGPAPSWGTRFYGDHAQSGGALVDLHIHDADFVSWCFGQPSHVFTSGSLTHCTTSYRFAHGPEHVTAEAAWDLANSAGFRMRYLVACEHATLDFDLARTPRLIVHGKQHSEPVPLPATLGYEVQTRALLSAIASSDRSALPTLEESARVMELLRAERASLASGARIAL